LRVKDYCVAKVTAVMPVITAVSTMSLSHCVWLRKASSVSVPGGLARSSICRVHYKPTFHLSSSMHRCRPSNQVSNSCTPQSQLDSQIQRSGWISRVMGKKFIGKKQQLDSGSAVTLLPVSAVFMCHSHAGHLLPVST